MDKDYNRELEERTAVALAKMDKLREQMVDTMNSVQNCAHAVLATYRANPNAAKVGHATTFKMRFALESSVEGLRDNLTRTRKEQAGQIKMLEETIHSGRVGLADMIDDDPNDPKIADRRHHLNLLEQLLVSNKSVLRMCDNVDLVVKEADEIILEIQ